MTVKVGDIVHYRGRNVRILKMQGDTRLAYFGNVTKEFNDSDLVDSNQALKFEVGDMVTICEIPKEERKYYGAGWMVDMTHMFGTTHTVTEVRDDSRVGRRVKLGGFWFQTYHLELANNYDMI